MATIHEYRQQTSAEGAIPTARAIPGRVGEGVESLGQALGTATDAVYERDQRQEVTDAYATAATIQAEEAVRRQNEIQNANPDDVAGILEKANERLKQRLDSAAQKYQTVGGKNTFERNASSLSAAMIRESGMTEAKVAGEKAIQNFVQQVDGYGIVVNNNPSMFGYAKSQLEKAFNDPNSDYAHIPIEHKPEMKRKAVASIAEKAMENIVAKGPEIGKQMLENPNTEGNPAQYLTGEQTTALKSKAEVGIRQAESAKDREEMAARRAKADKEEAIQSGFNSRIIDPRLNGGMPSDKEIASSGLSGPKLAEVYNFKNETIRQRAYKIENQPHPLEVKALSAEIFKSEDDPNKNFDVIALVRKSFSEGRLNFQEEQMLEGVITRLKEGGATKNLEQDVNTALNTTGNVMMSSIQFNGQPEKAIEALSKVRFDVYKKMDALRKENKNPRDVLNPNSKDYFFSEENLKSYTQTSPTVALQEGAKATLSKQEQAEMAFFNIWGYIPKADDPNFVEPSVYAEKPTTPSLRERYLKAKEEATPKVDRDQFNKDVQTLIDSGTKKDAAIAQTKKKYGMP